MEIHHISFFVMLSGPGTFMFWVFIFRIWSVTFIGFLINYNLVSDLDMFFSVDSVCRICVNVKLIFWTFSKYFCFSFVYMDDASEILHLGYRYCHFLMCCWVLLKLVNCYLQLCSPMRMIAIYLLIWIINLFVSVFSIECCVCLPLLRSWFNIFLGLWSRVLWFSFLLAIGELHCELFLCIY